MSNSSLKSLFEWLEEVKGLNTIIDRQSAEIAKQKKAYNQIFETYIPHDKMDEANSKLILLLVGKQEQMGRDLLKGTDEK